MSSDVVEVARGTGTETRPGRPGGTAMADRPGGRSEPSSPPPSTAPDPADSVEERNWFVPVLVLSIGGFMSVLDSSIVNVAVPVMGKEFGANSDDIEWVATAYSLSLGVIVPVSAWLGDRFGMLRTYVVSLLAFAATSMLCGFAWDLTSMVVLRILQAAPGGILPVVSMAMLYRIVPKDKIGAAMAVYGLGVVFAPGVGPTLGGYLVDYADWRWVFFINGPAGLIGAVLAVLLVRELPRKPVGRFDVWGFVTVAAGLFALLLAVSEGGSWGWTGYRILMLLTASVLLLALFVVIELEVEHPLINVRVFALWQFSNSLFLVSALSVGLFAVVFYIPIYLQDGQGRTAFDTGLVMFPEAVAMALAMPLAGILYDRLGPRIPVLVGLAVAAWGTYLMCGINYDVTTGDVMLWTCIRGAGNGMAIMSIMTAGMAVVPQALINEASALNNVVQRVSAALGLGVLTSMATQQQAQAMNDNSSLLSAHGPGPQVTAMMTDGPAAMIPLYQRYQTIALADAYQNVFLIIALFTAAGAVMGLAVRIPRDAEAGKDGDARHVMVH